MEVDLSQIPSQTGTATVEVESGKVIKSTGTLAGNEGLCLQLTNIFLDSVRSAGNEPVRRVSVCFGGYKYVMAYAEKVLYLIAIGC